MSGVVRTCSARKPALRALLAIGVSCLAGLAVPSSAAGAGAKIDLVCPLSVSFEFSPPLTSTTTTARSRGLLSSCTSPSGRYPRIKSGVVFATQPLVARGCSPAPLTMTGPGSGVLWSDGSESRFDLTISTDPTSGAFGFNALLISGTMRGARAVAAPLLLAQRGLCMLGGVRSLTMGFGVVALTNAAPAGRARTSRDRAGTRGRR